MSDSDTDVAVDVEPAARRGRPRPQDTIARDEKVLKALEGGAKSREELAAELGIESSHAYLSLFRLRKQGKVERLPQDGKDAVSNKWQPVVTA